MVAASASHDGLDMCSGTEGTIFTMGVVWRVCDDLLEAPELLLGCPPIRLPALKLLGRVEFRPRGLPQASLLQHVHRHISQESRECVCHSEQMLRGACARPGTSLLLLLSVLDAPSSAPPPSA